MSRRKSSRFRVFKRTDTVQIVDGEMHRAFVTEDGRQRWIGGSRANEVQILIERKSRPMPDSIAPIAPAGEAEGRNAVGGSVHEHSTAEPGRP